MVLLFENGFSGWGQFLQSFCRSTHEYVISLVASPLVIWQIHLCSCKSFSKIVPIQKNYSSSVMLDKWTEFVYKDITLERDRRRFFSTIKFMTFSGFCRFCFHLMFHIVIWRIFFFLFSNVCLFVCLFELGYASIMYAGDWILNAPRRHGRHMRYIVTWIAESI